MNKNVLSLHLKTAVLVKVLSSVAWEIVYCCATTDMGTPNAKLHAVLLPD
jgi:hypothetical protein